jgi:hypothetical protein
MRILMIFCADLQFGYDEYLHGGTIGSTTIQLLLSSEEFWAWYHLDPTRKTSM